jgi:hypothetical protein
MRTSFVDAYITSFTAVTIAPNNESTDEYHVLVVCEAR